MNTHEQMLSLIDDNEMVSLMDMLDIGEELIDSCLKTIMNKKPPTNRHLTLAIHLLQYKQLINIKEGTECENDDEYNYVVSLYKELKSYNVNKIGMITNIVLNLNLSNLLGKSEHLLQQMLCSIDIKNCPVLTDGGNTMTSNLMYLKICDSILDAIQNNNKQICLLFVDIPIANILLSSDEAFKTHFFMCTVPKLLVTVTNCNLLDRIWNHLKMLCHELKGTALKIIGCLSYFYLPIPDSQGRIQYKSDIFHHYEFWNLIIYGLMCDEKSNRKMSIYLTKRTLDSLQFLKKSVQVMSKNDIIFLWDPTNDKKLKMMWNDYFILLESLEETQSNIIMPALTLFENLYNMGNHWMNCIFNIGLKHDNTQIRSKCIKYRLKFNVNNKDEALMLLVALNDSNLFINDSEQIIKLLSDFVKKNVFILKSITLIKWSSIPLYHMSSILRSNNILDTNMEKSQILTLICDLMKVQCNNVTIRKTVMDNVAQLAISCFDLNLTLEDYIHLFSAFPSQTLKSQSSNIVKHLKEKFKLDDGMKPNLINMLMQTSCIDTSLLYLKAYPKDIIYLLNIVTEKMNKIDNLTKRQYSNKIDCLDDVLFLNELLIATLEDDVLKNINFFIIKEYVVILKYDTCLISDNQIFNIIDSLVLTNGLNHALKSTLNVNFKEQILQLYNVSVIFLKDKYTEISKKVLSLLNIKMLHKWLLDNNFKHEILTLNQIINILTPNQLKRLSNHENYGKLNNIFIEKSCELLNKMLQDNNENLNGSLQEIINFIETIMDIAGYNCLKWILKVINTILPLIIHDIKIKYNLPEFVDRVWKEIEELKSNNQFNTCTKEFVVLIMQDDILKMPCYNNLISCYCGKIVEYGAVNISPLYYLVQEINKKVFTMDLAHLAYILCEILTFSCIIRKDIRNAEKIEIGIINNPQYGTSRENSDLHFHSDITCLSVEILSKIKCTDVLKIIKHCMLNKLREHLKNKARYHENSQTHKILLLTLQHILFMVLIEPEQDNTDVDWAMELLGKLPHQPNVKICLEWYIALNYFLKGQNINENMLKIFITKNIQCTTQFVILYWILKHRILKRTNTIEEYEFVMDILLSNTMGPIFNTRLYAQFLALKLYKFIKNNSDKYSYTIDLIQKSFKDNVEDKNLQKIQSDYFVNEFDIIADLTPAFIYYSIPKYQDSYNEVIDVVYFEEKFKIIDDAVTNNIKNELLKQEWMLYKKLDSVFNIRLFKRTEDTKDEGNALIIGDIIQKKYIPWRSMTDLEIYDCSKKAELKNDLIVVASLIDKLPNLGGMVRTSEVFGVKTYVVDSLRRLQDKQFQGLSVSAERWVNIEEVRPGLALQKYIMSKKNEGYSIVAAEQTSTSSNLSCFKFPRKSVLMLGHEKEGIPCDILPLMDYCVEIPQQGVVRSLNVHVTASIFIWEYVRQHVLNVN